MLAILINAGICVTQKYCNIGTGREVIFRSSVYKNVPFLFPPAEKHRTLLKKQNALCTLINEHAVADWV
jgi:hypothetical protein